MSIVKKFFGREYEFESQKDCEIATTLASTYVEEDNPLNCEDFENNLELKRD